MKRIILVFVICSLFQAVYAHKGISGLDTKRSQWKDDLLYRQSQYSNGIRVDHSLRTGISTGNSQMPQPNQLIDSVYYYRYDFNTGLWSQLNKKIINDARNSNNDVIIWHQEIYVNGSWQNESRFIASYNANNYLTNVTKQLWGGSSWYTDSRYFYTYDANYNILSYNQQYFVGFWEDDLRILYSYDSNNNMLTEEMQGWIGYWLNGYRFFYSYDNSNRLIQKEQQNWYVDSNLYSPTTRYSFTYNANGDVLEKLEESHINSSSWFNNRLFANRYNANGYLDSAIVFRWVNNRWKEETLNDFTYDNAGNRINDFFQFWNDSLSTWRDGSRTNYTFNASGKQTSYFTESWNVDSSSWELSSDGRSAYDANDFELYRTNRFWIDQDTAYGDSIVSYFQVISNIESSSALDDIYVYPNPAYDVLKIGIKNNTQDNAKLTMRNITGQMVKVIQTNSMADHILIPVMDLPNGLYTLEIIINGRSIRRQVIVNH